eukprot:7415493-Pyramimonas_sp.AAC.1
MTAVRSTLCNPPMLILSYVVPILLKDHIPEIIANTWKKQSKENRNNVETVSGECHPGPDT